MKRLALQFTPYSWTDFDWRPLSSLKRWLAMLAVIAIVSLWFDSTQDLLHSTKHIRNVSLHNLSSMKDKYQVTFNTKQKIRFNIYFIL